MRRIWAQTRKELTQIRRDRLALTLALALPLALILLLSTAISLTVHNLPLIIQDFDNSMASRRFADAIRASPGPATGGPRTRCSPMRPVEYSSSPEISIGLWHAGEQAKSNCWWMPPIRIPHESCRHT